MSLSTRACGAFIAGAVVFHVATSLPDAVGWCVLLAGSALILRGRRWLLPALFAIGALWSAWHASVALDHRLDVPGDVVLTGTVSDLPTAGRGGRQSFTLRVRESSEGDMAALRRVRLHWYGAPRHLLPGEQWRVRTQLRPPAGTLNPGAFDSERWLIQSRVDATGTVVEGERLTPAPSLSLDRLRAELSSDLRAAVNPEAPGAMLVALAVGDRRFLSDQVWDTLLTTGTNHLVAISGLHVGLAGGLGLVIGAGVWRLCGRLPERVPARVVGALSGLTTAALYAALAGFTIPTQRALAMLVVTLVAVLARRPVRPTQVLFVAGVTVLVLDPLAPLDPGFWLSFAAVATLGVLLWGRAPQGSGLQWLFVQFRLALVLAPMTLLLFSHVALIAPLANIVAIPLVGLFTVPLVLLASLAIIPLPGVGGFLAGWSAWLLALFLGFADRVAALGESLPEPVMPAGVLAWGLVAVGVMLLIAPAGVPGRLLAVPLMVAAVWPGSGGDGGEVQLTTLDVGYGHASVLRTHAHAVVVDTGRTGREVQALLARSHNGDPDQLILTRDRAGYRGGRHQWGARPSAVIYDAVTAPERCAGGDVWQHDDVDFRLVDDRLGVSACVLQVEADGTRLLVASGLDPGQSARWSEIEPVDVVVLPASGHRDAVTDTMLDRMQPAIAVVSVDADNRYDLPHEAVLNRIRERGIKLLHTGQHGAVTITLNDGVRVDTARGRARWWNRGEAFGHDR